MSGTILDWIDRASATTTPPAITDERPTFAFEGEPAPPIETRRINGGVQAIYRFKNGYGASVVRHSFSYGGGAGLWELGVTKASGDDWHLTYETPITDDVIGHLSEIDVAKHLHAIAALPKAAP